MKEQIAKIKTFVKTHKEQILLGGVAVAAIGITIGAAMNTKIDDPFPAQSATDEQLKAVDDMVNQYNQTVD